MLAGASSPLIIAGGGVHYSEASGALAELAEVLGAPIAETSAGKGAGANSPWSVGAIGHSGTRAANNLARDADLILAVGTRLIDLTTGSNSLFQHPEVRVIGLNVSSADAIKLGATPLLADVRAGLTALTDQLRADAADTAASPRTRGEGQ